MSSVPSATQDLILQPPVMKPSIVVAAEVIDAVSHCEQAMGDAPWIQDQASCDAVRDVMLRAQAIIRAINAQRLQAKAPYTDVANQIDAAARPLVDRLERIKLECKTQMADFAAAEDRRRLELERARIAAEAAARASVGPGQMPQLLVQQLPAAAVQMPVTRRPQLVIFDPSLVPSEFWIVDTAAVEAAWARGAPVPGTRYGTTLHITAR